MISVRDKVVIVYVLLVGDLFRSFFRSLNVRLRQFFIDRSWTNLPTLLLCILFVSPSFSLWYKSLMQRRSCSWLTFHLNQESLDSNFDAGYLLIYCLMYVGTHIWETYRTRKGRAWTKIEHLSLYFRTRKFSRILTLILRGFPLFFASPETEVMSCSQKLFCSAFVTHLKKDSLESISSDQ